MAVLQKIRGRSAWLIAIIGLGLFAFVAEPLFESIKTLFNMDSQTVGKVKGQSLNIQDFQSAVQARSDLARLTSGNASLSEQQQNQIRETIWQEFEQNAIVSDQAKKLGLSVSDAEIKQALQTGQAQCLQQLAAITMDFGNGQTIRPFVDQQTGRFSNEALQQFLREAGREPALAEQYQQIYRVWEYSKEELRQELLAQKYFYVLQAGMLSSNPTLAKMTFDDMNVQSSGEVVAVPYSSLGDDALKVTDDELKKAFSKYKDMAVMSGRGGVTRLAERPTRTATFKYINVEVQPSDVDRDTLQSEVRSFEEKLRAAGGNYDALVSEGQSEYAYSYLPIGRDRLKRLAPEIEKRLDSVSVGGTCRTFFDRGAFATFKVIGTTQAADSVRYQFIVAGPRVQVDSQDQIYAESGKVADSIMAKLQGGQAFGEVAKEYNQQGDSIWEDLSRNENFGYTADQAKAAKAIGTLPVGVHKVDIGQGFMVVKIIDRKKINTKYDLAIIKRELNFSNDTYNDELARLNKFLADNKTLADFEKNAAGAGYVLTPANAYPQNDLTLQYQLGGEGAKEAVRWIFDDAKKGDVSKIYECGDANNRLLVVGVDDVNDGELTWDNPEVKQVLTQLVQREKAQAALKSKVDGVKTFEQAKALEGAVTDSLKDQVFFGNVMVPAVGTPEPKLSGALAGMKAGSFSGPIYGAGAVYFVKAGEKKQPETPYDEKQAMQQTAQMYMQMVGDLFGSLTEGEKVKDQRYKF